MAPEHWPTFMWGSVVYNSRVHEYGPRYPWELRLDPRQTATARDPQLLAAKCIAATREWILCEARRA